MVEGSVGLEEIVAGVVPLEIVVVVDPPEIVVAEEPEVVAPAERSTPGGGVASTGGLRDQRRPRS